MLKSLKLCVVKVVANIGIKWGDDGAPSLEFPSLIWIYKIYIQAMAGREETLDCKLHWYPKF